MIRRLRANIPNTITCLNITCGAAACVFSFYYSEQIGAFCGYQWAFILIAAAAVFDFCDGAMARLLHVYSLIGKELDSLSDLVSFGLAPALLMFNTITACNGGVLTPWAFVALLIAIIGAIRLAKFNVDDRQTTSFIGLPIPANAIFWIGTIAWIHAHTYPGNLAIAVIIVAVSLLMVSNLPMFSLKFANFDLKENFRRYLLIAAAALFLITDGIPGLAWTILLYILISAVCRRTA